MARVRPMTETAVLGSIRRSCFPDDRRTGSSQRLLRFGHCQYTRRGSHISSSIAESTENRLTVSVSTDHLGQALYALEQFAAWRASFYACRSQNGTLNSKRPSMLAELGMLSIPPCLLRATITSREMRRAAPQMITAVSVVEIGSMPTYHAERGKHIGENRDRQDQSSRLSDRV
jgi:hypothetical protein